MVEEKRLKLVYKGMYYKGISINTSPTMLAEYMKKSARNFIFLKPNDGGAFSAPFTIEIWKVRK